MSRFSGQEMHKIDRFFNFTVEQVRSDVYVAGARAGAATADSVQRGGDG